LRVYIESKEIGKNQGVNETAILSTNQGILTGRDAMKKKVGGELLFKIF
jgi:ribosomal protein S8